MIINKTVTKFFKLLKYFFKNRIGYLGFLFLSVDVQLLVETCN